VENPISNLATEAQSSTALSSSLIPAVPEKERVKITEEDLQFSSDLWIKNKTHWTETIAGKGAIEFVSRITLGGLFFSLMENSKAMHRMGSYRQTNMKNKDFYQESGALEKIAYGIDRTLGRGIIKVLDSMVYKGQVAKDQYGREIVGNDGAKFSRAKAAVRFRENRNLVGNQTVRGRSLGAEMTIVTASFAAMSAGSAIMRNILMGILNPTERHAWTKEGKFDPLHVVKRLGKKLWEVVTYNAGEDAIAAFAYVYFMKGWRNFIDKSGIARGFRYSSDNVDNGAGLRVDDKGNIIGHMLWGGAIDLQGRFTVYNVFTQIYRDIYNNIGGKITKLWNGEQEVKTPEWIKNPAKIPAAMYKAAKGTLRYTTVSAIRSILQMTPSVPFFSIFRISASKPSGLLVHSEYGALHFADLNEETGKFQLGTPMRLNMGGVPYGGDYKNHDPRYNRKRYKYENEIEPHFRAAVFAENTEDGKLRWFDTADIYDKRGRFANIRDKMHPTELENIERQKQEQYDALSGKKKKYTDPRRLLQSNKLYPYNPKAAEEGKEQFSAYNVSETNKMLRESLAMRTTDRIGKWMHKTTENEGYANFTGKYFFNVAKKLGYKAYAEQDDFVNKKMAKDALLAGIPYASYFAAKTVAREAFVNDQMNMAVERFVDGMLSFRLDEISNGIADMSNAIWRKPISNPELQAELIKRHMNNPGDKSPMPERWSKAMHRELAEETLNGGKIDKDEITRTVNKKRFDHYEARAKANIAKRKEYKPEEKRTPLEWAITNEEPKAERA
jgi:hypothetical protein